MGRNIFEFVGRLNQRAVANAAVATAYERAACAARARYVGISLIEVTGARTTRGRTSRDQPGGWAA